MVPTTYSTANSCPFCPTYYKVCIAYYCATPTTAPHILLRHTYYCATPTTAPQLLPYLLPNLRQGLSELLSNLVLPYSLTHHLPACLPPCLPLHFLSSSTSRLEFLTSRSAQGVHARPFRGAVPHGSRAIEFPVALFAHVDGSPGVGLERQPKSHQSGWCATQSLTH